MTGVIMKKIALLGGTFNPIHNAHVAMAQAIYESGLYDEIVFIPNRLPPHKDRIEMASASHRWNMCTLALNPYKEFSISNIEWQLKGRAYTIHTIQALQKANPNNRYYWVIGGDSLLDLVNWYKSDELLTQVSFIVLNRHGYNIDTQLSYLRRKYNAHFEIIPFKDMDISSTKIRKLIKLNQPISDYVPKEIEIYIQKYQLYQGMDLHAFDYDKTKEILKESLDEYRYNHSIAVYKMAIYLARLHHLDDIRAGIAGLLHDCAKAIKNQDKFRLCRKYQIPISKAEEEFPDLLHAKLGVIVAREKFQITDPEILNAIECHTTGKPNMNDLEKVIYISDYIEPNRTCILNREEILELAKKSLDLALIRILEDTLIYLKSSKKTIDKKTEEAYLFYKNYKEEKNERNQEFS